jgi:CRP/FNR family transcriptional regulator, cyclic AMP receptor protein
VSLSKLERASRPGPVTRIANALALAGPFSRRQRATKLTVLPAWSPFVAEPSRLPPQDQTAESARPAVYAPAGIHRSEIDPLYLFACHVEWERRAEPSAAWEIVSAAQSFNEDTRAQALALLACSHQVKVEIPGQLPAGVVRRRKYASVEANLKTPYGLEIIDSCPKCKCSQPGFFCAFSGPAVRCLELASHHTTLPAGAILFVEGQIPRGIFVLCSGRVKLSTASREGKVLILKFAEAGEALGLSAVISGMNYEMTAETAAPCQLNYIDRKNLMCLIEEHSEVGMHAAQALSREFQFAYRDMHDLVLARSSTGKLARLLLSSCGESASDLVEVRVRSGMTHEEMAQRIGASRETVTRLLSDLKKRRLLRLDGATLVIRSRPALEALVV